MEECWRVNKRKDSEGGRVEKREREGPWGCVQKTKNNQNNEKEIINRE